MLDKSTLEKLHGMNLSAFTAELERQTNDSCFSQMAFEDRLGLLVGSEWNRRRNNKLNRLIKKAAFSTPSATVEGIEYIEDRHLDKKQILRFAACYYIDEGHHVNPARSAPLARRNSTGFTEKLHHRHGTKGHLKY